MIEIEQKWIERFYFDPVMAAHVIMGARLDTFQKARLRFFWFTPETIDSSGVGTGKTIVDFVVLTAFLRVTYTCCKQGRQSEFGATRSLRFEWYGTPRRRPPARDDETAAGGALSRSGTGVAAISKPILMTPSRRALKAAVPAENARADEDFAGFFGAEPDLTASSDSSPKEDIVNRTALPLQAGRFPFRSNGQAANSTRNSFTSLA